MKPSYLTTHLLLLLFICLIIPSASFASVGKVKMVLGQVMVVNTQGDRTRLRRGNKVNVGDTIFTSKRGQAQLTMIDGTKISIRPGSKFLIEEFIATGKTEDQKTYYKLLRGGFRSVTGKIGKKNKNSFRLSTPVATMGIRGTDFTGIYCSDNCSASGGQNGLFIDVISGGVSMTNNSGTLILDKNTNGYVPSTESAPKNIETLPSNLLSPRATETKVGDKYPSPEEEMVQIALYKNPENKDAILSEAMDANVPPAKIMRSAKNAGLETGQFMPQLIKKGKERGMDPSDFVAPILDSGVSTDNVLKDLMSSNPESASDILTAAIATGEFDNNKLKQSAVSAGVTSAEVEAADTIGNLFALPPEVKELLKETKKVDDSNTETSTKKTPTLHSNELKPSTDSGSVASPS